MNSNNMQHGINGNMQHSINELDIERWIDDAMVWSSPAQIMDHPVAKQLLYDTPRRLVVSYAIDKLRLAINDGKVSGIWNWLILLPQVLGFSPVAKEDAGYIWEMAGTWVTWYDNLQAFEDD